MKETGTSQVQVHTQARTKGKRRRFRTDRFVAVIAIIVAICVVVSFVKGRLKPKDKVKTETIVSENPELEILESGHIYEPEGTEPPKVNESSEYSYQNMGWSNDVYQKEECGDYTYQEEDLYSDYTYSSSEIYSTRLGRYISEYEMYLLTMITYSEAGIEPYLGKVAVAATILNRMDSMDFPNTVYDVIFQPGQFSSANNGRFYSGWGDSLQELTVDTLYDDTLAEAREAVLAALNGEDPTYEVGGALYFYNPDYCSQEELEMRSTISELVWINDHIFYRVWD